MTYMFILKCALKLVLKIILYYEEDNVTYMFILKCALKLVLKNNLYYDARSEKHQIN